MYKHAHFASSLLHRHRHTLTLMIHIIQLMLLFSSKVSSQSVVEYLPGFSGKLPFKLETGYIGVGEKEDKQLFYYFFESESNPETDPLVLWLTGGPGCSGLSEIFFEFGAFTIDLANYYANSDGSIPKLILNEYSWTKVASIIFLDQPVGTGFSYATTQEASSSSDTLSAHHTYDFLRKWLMNNPKYLKNPLYICADSYGGMILPLVVDKVFKGIDLGSEPRMNMKGYSLGNPVTDQYYDINGRIMYAHRVGLLSDKLYESAKKACLGNYINVDQEDILCQNVLEKVNKCLNRMSQAYSILDPLCEGDGKVLGNAFSYESVPASFLRSPVASKKSWCRDDNYAISTIWANDETVQKALHIREGTITEWARCNNAIIGAILYVYDIYNTTSYHMNFTHKSCRALIYSGDHDFIVPHTSTERWINLLNVPIQSDWRPWFVEGQVAGYTMTYGYGGTYELTYATLKGAGHIAPEFTPKQCFAMIRNWFNHNDL